MFYIWTVGGAADEVVEALLRAAKRGVICRVLLDAVGSHDFLISSAAERLRAGNVALFAALPVGAIRMLFYRLDLRMHRKIAVLDGEIGYTGSMNLVDPRFFKVDAGVGQWVDALVRMRGPAVEALGVTFLEDWELETGEGHRSAPRNRRRTCRRRGRAERGASCSFRPRGAHPGDHGDFAAGDLQCTKRTDPDDSLFRARRAAADGSAFGRRARRKR